MYREILAKELKLDTTLGYLYFLDKEHPFASGNAHKIYYHRHVMSVYLGRWLTYKEHVHHKDGIKINNDVSNLEILSHEEHAALHSGKNTEVFKCVRCQKEFEDSPSRKRKYCGYECFKLSTKKLDISKEDLEILIWNLPYTKIASKFGVSDNAIKKRAITLGCRIPPTRFHNKSNSYKLEQRILNNIADLSSQ